MLDIIKPDDRSYIILESLTLEKNSSRMVHVLSVDESKDTFRLGRGHESDVRVNDISVSRCHAILKYKDHSFFVEDNLSKFGTLVLVKDKIEIEQNFTKAVQIGRSVISFTAKETKSISEK